MVQTFTVAFEGDGVREYFYMPGLVPGFGLVVITSTKPAGPFQVLVEVSDALSFPDESEKDEDDPYGWVHCFRNEDGTIHAFRLIPLDYLGEVLPAMRVVRDKGDGTSPYSAEFDERGVRIEA